MAEEVKQDKNAIITKQIEFYMSDGNLKRDKFFRELIQKNEDGYVPVAAFLKCLLVKKHTEKRSEVIAALETSEKLELNEAKNKVKRKIPLDVEALMNGDPFPSVFIDGIDREKTSSDLFEEFEKFGEVSYVTMQAFKFIQNKQPQFFNYGHAFIEFKDEAGVQKVLENYPAFNLETMQLTTPAEPTACSQADYEKYLKELQDKYVANPGSSVSVHLRLVGKFPGKDLNRNDILEAVERLPVQVKHLVFRFPVANVALASPEEAEKVFRAGDRILHHMKKKTYVRKLSPYQEAWFLRCVAEGKNTKKATEEPEDAPNPKKRKLNED